jgi:hypothetical protein
MAAHWSRYVPNVTDKQAYALDRIAEDQGHRDGKALLCDLAGGVSPSKLEKVMSDWPRAKRLIDEAFALRA